MHDVTTLDCSRIAQDLQIRKIQVESVVQLLDEGNTVPFITRYRKERTGGLDEEVIRKIQSRVGLLRQLAERKQTILKSIENQGKLTEELRTAIVGADTSKRLEDLYLPYKPKKRSLATEARERGLEPLALAVWNREPAVANLAEVLPTLVNPEKGLNTPEDVRAGVQYILAEQVSETADVRASVRRVLWETGKICSAKSDKVGEDKGQEYKDYFQFTESLRQIPPHRILALNRGEKEGILKVRLEFNTEGVTHAALSALADHLLKPPPGAAVPAAEGVPPATDTPPPEQSGELLAPTSTYRTPHADFLRIVTEDALTRLILPSLEREIRRELTDEAKAHAVHVFARNLRSLLLQRPLWGRRVLAIDPGFRTGCKIAALDEHGNLLDHTVIFPHATNKKHGQQQQPAPPPPTAAEAPPAPAIAENPPANPEAGSVPPPAPVETPPADGTPAPIEAAATAPPPVVEPAAAEPPVEAPKAQPSVNRKEEAKAKLAELVTRHNLDVVAIGNGTGCRETEELVSELIGDQLSNLAYVIVIEAGASVYSASAIGREEFPDYDATLRGTISIGRRLQDPLSELVKVDPPNIGVGLYQHDIDPKQLKESLDGVVESCVNQVGVDLNTASVPLLRHVAGLNQLVARELVDYRKQNGPFRSRDQLLQVPNVGPARFTQAAGFLKIRAGDNPLDQTWIHPESYEATKRLLGELGYGPDVIEDRGRQEEFQTRLKSLAPEEVAARLEVGVPTLRDILDALAKPGRDPREELPPPIFKKGILKLEDLQASMELKGTVLNVVDFGAFVDIGLKDSGLVHISQMANRYIKSPYDVVAVGDVVTVWVLNVDQGRRRVSLTMIKPGTERKPQERKPQERRPQERSQQQPQPSGARPPRGGRRPPPRPQEQGGGRGPRPGGSRAPAQTQTASGSATTEQATGATAESAKAPQPTRLVPPRKPRREAPRPKLSQDALEGKVPLRTFSELSALFAAKQVKREPPPPPAPEPSAPSTPQETTTPHEAPANQAQDAGATPP